QWDQVVAAVKARKLVAFLDMAYQGFAQGITEDGLAVQKFVASGENFFVSTSFSKSLSLYGERVGALSVLCQDKEEASRVLSQLVGMFSNSVLTMDQMLRLRNDFGVYGIESGRICLAALNSKNIDYVAECIAKVVD